MTPSPQSLPLEDTKMDEAVRALRKDLLAAGGHSINTMRNHAFAILPYPPEQEFVLRRRIRQLTVELQAEGWAVLQIDLHQLLLQRVDAQGADYRNAVVGRESRLFAKDQQRALDYLSETLMELIEGPDGLAADVTKQIRDFAAANSSRLARSLVLVGRMSALYPFARSSALLKHIANRTMGLPVVLLYPGIRTENTALSFMGELPPDRDYRPRIYP